LWQRRKARARGPGTDEDVRPSTGNSWPELLRVGQWASAAALAGAGAMGQSEWALLVEAQERVNFRGQRERIPVAIQNRKAVVAIDGPVGPLQRLHGESGIVGGGEGVAAVDEID